MSRNLDVLPKPGQDATLDRQSRVGGNDNLCHIDRLKLLQDGACNVAGLHDRKPMPGDSATRYLPTISVPADRPAAESKLTEVKAPAQSQDSPAARAQSTLMDNSAKPEDRLKAARDLVNQGIHSLKVKDENGHESTLRLDLAKAGNRDMVHVFVKDGKHERVALRGNIGQNGVEEQKDAHGKSVGFEGKGADTFKHMRLVDGQAPTVPHERPGKPENGPVPEPRRDAPLPPKRPDGKDDAPARTHSRHQQNRPEHQQPGQEPPQMPGRRQADEQGERAQRPLKPDANEGEQRTPRPPKQERQNDQSFFPGQRPDATPDNNHSVRQLADRSSFYRHQNDAVSCSAFSMAMMYSDHKLGRPVNDSEAYKFKQLAGVTSHGYRGSLADMGRQLESAGLHARPYEYANNFNERGMADLNRELAAGHSAVARVINPHTGNPHYIYIAGRDSSGRYIVGDPDRKNLANHQPVSAERLYSMMRGRNGFVAGW